MTWFFNFILFNTMPVWKRNISALVYTLLLILLAYVLGGFEQGNTEYELYLRMRNAAIGMPVFTIYFWLSINFINTNVEKALSKYEKSIDENTNFSKALSLEKLRKIGIKNCKMAIFLGIQTTALYCWYEGLLVNSSDPLLMFLIISAVPFWVSCWLILFQLYTVTKHIINRIVKQQELDLFGLKNLLPLSDQFISYAIIVSIVFALSPIFWIGKAVPVLDIVLLCAVFVFLMFFFFKPIFAIQSKMYQIKKLAIKRINYSIKNIVDTKREKHRRITDDPKRLRELSALIQAKNEISETSEWAVSVPQQIRGTAIVLAIPLSWVAASLVESGIGSLGFFN